MSEDLQPILQYLNQPNTDYAYMLTGAWGSGKTYFWKHVVVPALTPSDDDAQESQLVYVPLQAVASADDIRKAVIAQLHPLLATGGRWLGLLAPTVLEYLPVPGPVKTGGAKAVDWVKSWGGWAKAGTGGLLDRGLSALRGGRHLVICFDDLERAAMPLKDVLGQINQFVEHLGAKVVILCNEDEILNGDDAAATGAYRKAKEKVVRITRAFSGDIQKVATAMIAQFAGNEPFHEILRVHRDLVLSICGQGAIKNLRSLKFSLLLLETACTCAAELAPGDKNLVEQVIRSLLPVALDLQERHLNPVEATQLLTDGSAVVVAAYAADADGKPPLVKFGERYGFGLLGPRLWTSPALAELVTAGRLDRAKLKAQLDAEAVEQSPEKVAVETLMDSWISVSDEELRPTVELALAGVRSGDITPWKKLYRLALALDWMLSADTLPVEISTVDEAFTMGIKASIDRETFEPVAPWLADHEFLRHGPEGELARRVREQLLAANLERVEADHRAAVRKAFAELSDENPFSLMLSEAQDRGFGNRAIAQFIAPDEFVRRVLTADNRARHALRYALDRRYQKHQSHTELAADLPWLIQVQSGFETAITQLTPDQKTTRYLLKQLLVSLTRAQDSIRQAMDGSGSQVTPGEGLTADA